RLNRGARHDASQQRPDGAEVSQSLWLNTLWLPLPSQRMSVGWLPSSSLRLTVTLLSSTPLGKTPTVESNTIPPEARLGLFPGLLPSTSLRARVMWSPPRTAMPMPEVGGAPSFPGQALLLRSSSLADAVQ